MKILFVNNHGGGYADYLTIDESTTIDRFFKNQFSGEDADDYLIRVNRQPVPKDYVLQENDRVTVTPVKLEGADSSA